MQMQKLSSALFIAQIILYITTEKKILTGVKPFAYLSLAFWTWISATKGH